MFRIKELATYIKKEFPDINWRANKCVNKNCKLRPDLLAEFDKFILIIEVDELRHIEYKQEYERLETISKQFEKPVHIIRFNPDDYS